MRLSMTIIAIGALTLGGCSGDEPGRVRPTGGPVSVMLSEVVTTPASHSVPARVRTSETATLATRTSGTIRSVRVDVGQRVERGDLLVELDGSTLDANLRRAAAAEELARKYYERIRNLEADGAATGQELDEAQANLEMATAAREEVEAQQGYVAMRAPFDGIVSARYADPGDLAVPGQPVLVVSGLTGLEVEADVPASMSVRQGDPVVIADRARGRAWKATASRVVPVLDAASHRFRVESTFDAGEDESLPIPGQFVTLELPSVGENTRWIPTDAIVTRGQLRGVFVVEEGALRLRWLRIGAAIGGATEVLGGLPRDALVVRRPDATLGDGVRVENSTREPWTPEGVS